MIGTAVAALAGCASTVSGGLNATEASLTPGVVGGADDFELGPAPSGTVVLGGADTAMSDMGSIRHGALVESALAYGSAKGHAERSYRIMERVKSRVGLFSQGFDFSRVVVRAPGGAGFIIPPIVSAGRDAFSLSNDGKEAAVADAYLTITAPGRISGVIPTWRDYVLMTYSEPEQPPRSVLPRDAREAEVFNKAVQEGIAEGMRAADDEFEQRLANLERDYRGMLQYRKLVAQGMMDEMVLSTANFGVTAQDGEMRIGSRVIKITSDADFQANPKRWNVGSLSRSGALVTDIGGQPTLGDMLEK